MSQVPYYLDILGNFLKYKDFWIKFGDLETKLLTYDTISVSIDKPIFITGLARSGTTILLEILASHPDISTHKYKDYPFVHTNYFWNTLRKFIPSHPDKVERAHKDGIFINSESPEALDEILWMSFFSNLHDPSITNALSEIDKNAHFEEFYKDHIKKLICLRSGRRFCSKNNYNLTRIAFLSRMFPDAKFIIPLRKPQEHIFSMLKQHKMIMAVQKQDLRALRYMQRYGHFEFGLDFRPVNVGRQEELDLILNFWKQEKYLLAYSYYWKYIYEYIYFELCQNLPKNCLFIRYDTFCSEPLSTLQNVFDFCEMDGRAVLAEWAGKIKPPNYYKMEFTSEDVRQIEGITKDIEALLWP